MADDDDRGSVVRRIVDEIEDRFEGEDRDDEREKRSRGHSRAHVGSVNPREPLPIVVNVNVECDCCPSRGIRHKPHPAGTRPSHTTGSSDGTIPGGVISVGNVISVVTRPPNVWPGPRDKLFVPFLFMRANAGDLGARPVVGPFWESPDIMIEPGVAPSNAPAIPTSFGGVADAGKDNTIYAHVWNFGQAPCPETLVEFFWFNPALGFDDSSANLIGATWIDFAARGSAGSHRLVRCPVSWRAQYLNGGHECLVVRASQPLLDPLSTPQWDASQNRHVGQRNIHVESATGAGGDPTFPIAVGPLFGGVARVEVARTDTAVVPWVHMLTMDRNKTLANGTPTGDVGLTPPTPAGTKLPNLNAVPDPRAAGLIGDGHTVTADGQQVGFHANDGNPGPGKAHIYRVTGTQNGVVFGGYTVIVVGS